MIEFCKLQFIPVNFYITFMWSGVYSEFFDLARSWCDVRFLADRMGVDSVQEPLDHPTSDHVFKDLDADDLNRYN